MKPCGRFWRVLPWFEHDGHAFVLPPTPAPGILSVSSEIANDTLIAYQGKHDTSQGSAKPPSTFATSLAHPYLLIGQKLDYSVVVADTSVGEVSLLEQAVLTIVQSHRC
jgi:hypothetical protein